MTPTDTQTSPRWRLRSIKDSFSDISRHLNTLLRSEEVWDEDRRVLYDIRDQVEATRAYLIHRFGS